MAEDDGRGRRVRKPATPPRHQVEIELVAGTAGVVFHPASVRVPAGTVCLWRNRSGRTQEVLAVGDGPPFKGGPLPVGGTRLVLARRPAAFALGLASNPAARIAVEVTPNAPSP